ncbi:uncharacterized protein LOC135108613 [Scylla paramamosain]|uniref:uncharacterized protein LOC135108613 n=1 Tax=Scylla paramamosain TaxID=85552 RepID=UPI0030831B5D
MAANTDSAPLPLSHKATRPASEVEFVKVTQFRVLKERHKGEGVTLKPDQTPSRGPQDKLKPLQCYLALVKMFRPTANSKLKGKLHSPSQRYQDSPDNPFIIPHQPGPVTSMYQDPDNFSLPVYVQDSHSPTPRSQGSNASVPPCYKSCSPPPDTEISQSKLLFYKISTSSPTPANLMPDFLMPIPPPLIPSKYMEDDFESDNYITDIPVPPTVLPPYSMPPSPLPPYPVPPSPLQDCPVPPSPLPMPPSPAANVAADATKPTTPLSDATKPSTPLSNATKPGTPLPDAAKPGTPLPDATKPGTPLSDAAKSVLYTEANFSIPDPRQPDVPPPLLAYASASSLDSDKPNARRSRIDLPGNGMFSFIKPTPCRYISFPHSSYLGFGKLDTSLTDTKQTEIRRICSS